MRKVLLEDVCDFFNGGAWSDKEYVVKGLPVLKVTNCKVTGYQIDDVSFLPYESAEKYAKNKLQLKDVIIATVGSHPNLVESAAGRSCIVNSQVEGFYLNQNAVCLRTKDVDILDQSFLGYMSKDYMFRHYIQNRGRGAANQMRIAISAIKEYKFELPEINIQRKISNILSMYDDLIENNQKQINLLEEAAQRLYKEWFLDLRFPNYEECNIVEGLPAGWKRVLVSEVCETIGGGTPTTKVNEYYQGGDISWVTPTDITRNNSLILLDSEKKITKLGLEKSSARMVPPYTILMTSRASVGYFGICEHEVCTNQGVISCVPYEENVRYFLLYNLTNRIEEIRQKASGSTFLEISKKSFREFEIVLPDSNALEMFNKVIIPYIKQMEISVKKMSQLVQARDRLLPKLMNGEIEI